MRGDRIVELLVAAMAAVVTGLALAASTTWPVAAVVAGGLAVGVLFGAIGRALAHGSGPLVPRAAVGTVVGVLLGELAAVVLFGGAVDARLAKQPTPATEAAAAALAQARADRAGLDPARRSEDPDRLVPGRGGRSPHGLQPRGGPSGLRTELRAGPMPAADAEPKRQRHGERR